MHTSLTWLQAANFYRGVTLSPVKKLRLETSKFMYIIDRINVCHAAANFSSLNYTAVSKLKVWL